jgi:Mg-chelatase subunit ChlD
MDKKRARLTYLMVAGAMVLVAWAASAMPRRAVPKTLTSDDPGSHSDPKNPLVQTVPKARPRIEVVFALDTTGSMSGLIDGAKHKIWSIANFIAQGNPKPELRVGLVAYRDKGDAYVTRFYDLSDDLDTVFEHLSSFEAQGGGDTPEHVSKALYDAVHRASWSTDQGTLKQVYLVGDAPPHTDYNDGFDYHKIAREAHDAGIHINTIRCGFDSQTQTVWNEISRAAAGEYASIDQSGGVIAVATPYDDRLAVLNAKLVDTAIGYGHARGAVEAKKAGAMRMEKAVAADRASVMFEATDGLGGVAGDGDLVRDFAAGKAKPSAMPAAALPAEMAAMPAPEREAYVRRKMEERKTISAEIGSLSAKRNAFLKDKVKADAFDAQVEGAIRAQAKSIGVKY